MSIDTRLAEIQARCAAATKGPWTPMEYDHNPGDQGVPIIGGGERGSMAAHLTAYTMTLSNVDQSEADAEFIAHSRTDLPTLLAAVEAVLELHRPDTVLAVTGDCALEDCDHEDLKDCETVEVRFCAACDELAEGVDPYYSERGMGPVAWPCQTITALTTALEAEG